MLSVLNIIEDTMVDGPGFRTSIYCAGCVNACKGCQNPSTWDINAGTMTSTEDILKEILTDEFADVTFTGGDPMYQAEGFAELAEAIKHSSSKNIWCYTGCVLETDLLADSPYRCDATDALLQEIDVLVDGPFVEEQKSLQLAFRGSANQRILRKKNGVFTEATQ